MGEWKGWREGVRWESGREEEREVRRSGGSECACVWGKRMMREKQMSM